MTETITILNSLSKLLRSACEAGTCLRDQHQAAKKYLPQIISLYDQVEQQPHPSEVMANNIDNLWCGLIIGTAAVLGRYELAQNMLNTMRIMRQRVSVQYYWHFFSAEGVPTAQDMDKLPLLLAISQDWFWHENNMQHCNKANFTLRKRHWAKLIEGFVSGEVRRSSLEFYLETISEWYYIPRSVIPLLNKVDPSLAQRVMDEEAKRNALKTISA